MLSLPELGKGLSGYRTATALAQDMNPSDFR
jgi:hypothetical protein